MQTLVRRKQEGLFYNRKKKMTSDRKRHYMIKEEPISQEDIALLNVYAQMNNM